MKSMTLNEIVDSITENLSINDMQVEREHVKAVLLDLADLAASEIGQGNEFAVPGIAKVLPVYRPAKPKRTLVWGGVEREAQAKPASLALRARPARSLKDAVPSTRSAVGRSLGKLHEQRTAAREKAARSRARRAA
jgi:hypothetical protein